MWRASVHAYKIKTFNDDDDDDDILLWESGMVAHACNPSSKETEARGS